MKNKIIGIIAIIIIIGLVAIAFTYTGGETPYWETETEFGMFQDELIIEFADGTTKSMKIIGEEAGVPFTVYYGGKAITGASIKLSATVSGSGYTGANIEFTGFGYDMVIKQGSTVKFTGSGGGGSNSFNIGMGDTVKLMQGGLNLDFYINQHPSEYPSGTYTLTFTPKGTFRYRGYPDGGAWETATLPPTRTITLDVQQPPTGSILVILGSSVVT